jgi:hypothetical protein
MGPFAKYEFGSKGFRNNLPIPSWFRKSETSRNFPLPCSGAAEMKGDFEAPFTCGSPSRRAIIKYFVRKYASTTGTICATDDLDTSVQEANKQRLLSAVHNQLTKLYEAWSDYTKFSCEKKTLTNASTLTSSYGGQYCSSTDPETWTPSHLRSWDHVSSADVAKEIFASTPCFYERVMRDAKTWTTFLDKEELDKMQWSKSPVHAYNARESSLFHTHKPVVSYNESELNNPLMNGTVSFKEMCAGLLSQVYFTLPLKQNDLGQYVASTLQSTNAFYSPFTASQTPNVTALEDFILRISREAFYLSPFYRHYAMRHLASNSSSCPSFTSSLPTTTPLQNEEYQVNTSFFNNGQPISLKRKGFLANLLGQATTKQCFCAYEYVDDAAGNTGGNTAGNTAGNTDGNTERWCILPSIVVSTIEAAFKEDQLPSTPDTSYLMDNIILNQDGKFLLKSENHIVQRILTNLWPSLGQDSSWPCPLLELSDQWGFVKNATAWVLSQEESLEINVTDFLEAGYGGLRAGTIQHQKLLAQKLSPADISFSGGVVNPSDGSPVTGHTFCEADRPSMKPESLAQHFVDNLFPASQGVMDSPAISHCMRYSIELARLQVLSIVTESRNISFNANQQAFSQNAWRAKCAAQIDLLGMCASTKALDARGGSFSKQPSCPFALSSFSGSTSTSVSGGYITPGCLVYIYASQTVHDPCLVHDCSSAAGSLVLSISQIRYDPGTLVPFNPLKMVNALDMSGGSWSLDPPSSLQANTSEYDLFLQRASAWYSDLTRAFPAHLNNTQPLRKALFDLADEKDPKYCDMMVDWWPEQFEHPVGYHPTVPCSEEETSYRTYDQVFAYKDGKMIFVPLGLRDKDKVHTHFGVEGICRTSNYNMDMMEINTARICTRQDPSSTPFDPSVPLASVPLASDLPSAAEEGEEYCSSTSRDVPWHVPDPDTMMGTLGRSILSVGCVNFFSLLLTNRSAFILDSLKLKQFSDKFGDRCTHGPLPTTCEFKGCAPGYRCHNISKTCVLNDATRCYVHSDCAASDKMCSGDGYCVSPIIEIRNSMTKDAAEFRIYTEECPLDGTTTRVDMYGASPWERVPDILHSHGLCAYRNWFEYNLTLPQECNRLNPQTVCLLDGRKSAWKYTSLTNDETYADLVSQGILKQEAHICDRDYMHLLNRVSCTASPANAWWKRYSDGNIILPSLSNVEGTYLKQASVMKIYHRFFDGIQVKMGVLPNIADSRFGFLGKRTGKDGSLPYLSYPEFGFKRCISVKQCSEQPFSVYGYIKDRRIRRPDVPSDDGLQGVEYTFGHQFQCGGFGYLDTFGNSPNLDSHRCRLDLGVATLYRVLCFSSASRAAIFSKCRDNVNNNNIMDDDEATFLETYCKPFTYADATFQGKYSYSFSSGAWKDDGYLPEWKAYTETTRLAIPLLLNQLAEAFSPISSYLSPSFVPSYSMYLQAVECGVSVYAQISTSNLNNVPMYELENGKWVRPTSIYRFSQYGLYEYPFSWFFKCFLLVGRSPSDELVSCPGWTNSRSLLVGATTTTSSLSSYAGMSMWTYLTTVEAGVLKTQVDSEALSKWNALVSETLSSLKDSDFFDTDPLDSRILSPSERVRRVCSKGRELVKAFIDASPVLANTIMTVLNSTASGRFYPPGLFGPYADISGTRIICRGVSGEAGCTSPSYFAYEGNVSSSDSGSSDSGGTTPHTAAATTSLYDAAMMYLNMQPIEASDLMRATPSADGKIPLTLYSNLQMDRDSKVLLNPSKLSSVLQSVVGWGEKAAGSFCPLQSIDVPATIPSRSCFITDFQLDKRITDVEDAFPNGGVAELNRLRGTTPFLITLWGDDAHSRTDWEMPWKFYNNDLEYRAAAMCSLYDNEVDLAEHWGSMPANGGGAMDLLSKELSPKLVQDYLGGDDSVVRVQPYSEAARMSLQDARLRYKMPYLVKLNSNTLVDKGMDSFCGIVEAEDDGVTYREDPCSPLLAFKFGATPGACAGATGTLSSRDVNSGQTCIHDHSCMMRFGLDASKLMVAHGYDLGMERFYQRFISALGQGWVSNAFTYLGVNLGYSVARFMLKDTLVANEMWRYHGRKTSKAKFYLPIGVFLETFKDSQWVQDNEAETYLDIMSLDLYKPSRALGMWPMCPHGPDTSINYMDQQKSQMLQGFNVNGAYAQNPLNVRRGQGCAASQSGIQQCNIDGGYRSFRVGLASGFHTNPRKCKRYEYAMPVMRGIYKCTECTWWTPKYCEGEHDCYYATVKNALKLARWQERTHIHPNVKRNVEQGDIRIFQGLENANVNSRMFGKFMSDRVALEAMVSLLADFLIEKNGGSAYTYSDPKPLPFYENDRLNWNALKPFETYDARGNQAYDNSLPEVDPGTSLRCVNSTHKFTLDYKQCDFDDNYRTLQTIVQNEMRVKEGLVIPPLSRAAYYVSKKHMLTEGIAAWSLNTRLQEDRFVSNLLNSSVQCRHASRQESICSVRMDGRGVYVLNPWIGGNFNVFESSNDGTTGGCDTNQLDEIDKAFFAQSFSLDSSCSSPSVCSAPETSARWDAGVAQVCRDREGNPERSPTVQSFSDHNLCAKKPKANDLSCKHPQGMMFNLMGEAVGDLYSETFSSGSKTGGIFENPMAAGRKVASAKYGAIRSKEDEIAGHHVVYEISSSGVLSVAAIPLRGEIFGQKSNAFIISDFGGGTAPWLPSLAVSIRLDQPKLLHMRYDPAKKNDDWTCPLRQVFLWSGQGTAQGFVPVVPNPQRAGRMYRQLLTPYVDIVPAHPTAKAMEMDVSARLHTGYWTTNGFCVYLQGQYPENSEACSLMDLARSVWDQEWRNFTTVFPASQKCTAQVDWPYTPTNGRDGSFTPSMTAPRCAVLDRLPKFQYRIKTDAASFVKSGKSTVSKGGVCHMGRASEFLGRQDCWKIKDEKDRNVMRCSSSPTTDREAKKKKIRTPFEMHESAMKKRQLCSQCSAPPEFVLDDDDDTKKMPVPEVGYGRPFKWETARMLAGDLRFLLCGNATECEHIDADEWTLDKFLQNYFQSPSKLSSSSFTGTENKKSLEDLLDEHDDSMKTKPSDLEQWEKDMWERHPWVICNKDLSNCSGTISKEDWFKDRAGTCSAKVLEFLEQNPASLAVELDLCNLNGQMDSLCKDILDSVLKVTNANCIVAGNDVCLDKTFFYSPAIFSSSNQQFVRDTVRDFYLRFGDGGDNSDSDTVCQADDHTAELIRQNSLLNMKCGSVALTALKTGLEGGRAEVDLIIKILYDINMIIVDFMQMMSDALTGADMQRIIQDAFYWFNQLVFDMKETLLQLGNMLYKMLFQHSPLGTSLSTTIRGICLAIDWLINVMWNRFLCPIMSLVVPGLIGVLRVFLLFIDKVLGIINSIACFFNNCIPNSDAVAKIIVELDKTTAFIIESFLQCKDIQLSCSPDNTYSAQTASLPTATRCWAGYQPEAGDASVLSCTRADTCYMDGGSSSSSSSGNSNPIVCDACPRQSAEDFMQFACSALTKRCTCGVQRYERTKCSTHEQCYAGETFFFQIKRIPKLTK